MGFQDPKLQQWIDSAIFSYEGPSKIEFMIYHTAVPHNQHNLWNCKISATFKQQFCQGLWKGFFLCFWMWKNIKDTISMSRLNQNKNNWTKGKKNYISYQAMNNVKLDQKQNL